MPAKLEGLLSAKQLLLTFTLLLTATSTLFGQQTAARPDRGVTPGGSYSVSDIENINLQNGNVNLSIPLASLPPIAGGRLGFSLSANYNSKLWNITRSEHEGDVLPYRTYVVDTPQLNNDGGWSIGGTYQILFREAREDFNYLYPPSPNPNDAEAVLEYDRVTHNIWRKVVLRTPDGAEHELRPSGPYLPYFGLGHPRSYLWGYYKDTPDNTGQPMRYNSSDGTYLSAIINPAGHASGIGWTIFLPDGTQVINYTAGFQRIRDNNGNSIKIFSDANGTHYQDEHTCPGPICREIRSTYDPQGAGGYGQAQIWYQTVGGGSQHIDINYGQTIVQGKIYDVQDWNPNVFNENGIQGAECTRREQLTPETLPVVREIVFPATEVNVPGKKFSFSYNSDTTETANTPVVFWTCGGPLESYTRPASRGLGALSEMLMPSGAKVEYTYTLAGVHDFTGLNTRDRMARETLITKKLYHDELYTAATAETWEYSIPNEPNSTVSSVNNPDGSSVTQAYYPIDPNFARFVGNVLEVRSGLVFSSSNGVTQTLRHWVAGSQIATGSTSSTTFNPLVDAEYTLLVGTTTMSARTYQHDLNGNVTQVADYDWFDSSQVTLDDAGVPTGPPAGLTPVRVTNTSYYNSAPNTSSGNYYIQRTLATGTPSILNAVQETSLLPGITRFSYDGQSYGVAPTLGNLTSQSTWDDLDNKWITSSQTYGWYGNLATKTDPRGKATEFFYDDLTHAMPTRVVVDPQNGTGTQTATTVFDHYTGQVTSQTDPNGNTSTIDYTNQLLGTADPFGRPGVVDGPNVGGNQRQRVRTTYQDSLRRVIVAADQNTPEDQLLKTMTTVDMLGRPILSEQSEDGTNYTIYSRKAYQQMGKITYASNPMRYNVVASTDGWTRVTNDNAGRIVEVETFGGAAQPPPPSSSPSPTPHPLSTGRVSTTYQANFTTVTDQAGKQRRSQVDALGRLIRVDEPDANNNLGSTASPNQATAYTYDVFGNLRTVAQGTQTRTFNYDSLSRLRSATNPESGAITYNYDDNGNLQTKTDARGVVTTYTYDALNRNTGIGYSDGTIGVGRVYDQTANGKGRVSWEYRSNWTDSGSVTSYNYDALGRITNQNQHYWVNTWSAPYSTNRTYDLAGHVTSQTYPSGHSVNYSYDSAGRLTNLTGNLGDGAGSRPYSTGMVYSPMGGMAKEQFGTDTPVYHKSFYNSRGQLSEILASTSYTGPADTNWNRGKLINWYGAQCGGSTCLNNDNNGNLRKQETFIPHNDGVTASTSWRQEYDYDSLNRLQRVKELNSGGGQLWQQEYVYDRWGNRTIHQTNTWDTWGPASGPVIPKPNFAVDPANNRLTPPAGFAMNYDAAGNVILDNYLTGQGQRIYDAENRMTQASVNGQWQVYTYNALGQRVSRKVNNLETWLIYGIDGELVAEYPAIGTAASPQKEYGYRNGQLLITADAPQSSPPPAPTRVSVTTSTAQSLKLDKPANLVAGDVLIAIVASSYAYNGGVPTPAGWTLIRSVDQGSQIIHIDTYYHVVTGNEPPGWSWQLGDVPGNPNGNPDAKATGSIIAYRGVNTTAPISASNTQCCTGGTSTSVASINTPTANNLVLAVFAEGQSNSVYTPPAGLTGVMNVTNGEPAWGNHHMFGEFVMPAAGPTGHQIATNGAANGSDAAQLIALQPSSSAAPTRVSVATSSTASLNLVKPANLLAGDVLIAIVASSYAYNGGVPTPAGWTLIRSVDQGSQIIHIDTYYHVVDGNEPLGWSWQLGDVPGNPNGNPDARATGSIIAYRGVNTAAPISASNTQCCTGGTNTSVASINTPTANNLVLAVFAEGQSNSVYTPPAGLTGVMNVTNGEPNWGNHHMFGELLMPAAGPTGHQIATNGAAHGSDTAQLIALQPSSAASIANLQWLVADHLGTPRMIFDKTGSLANVKRHDYLPFGEELVAYQGGRTPGLGYTADNVRQKFTSKERDNETGLDYFIARYYSSTQGRFTSPDEFGSGPDELYHFVDDASANPTFYGDLTNPQSLNKYQYAYNNPLRYVDPDGHDVTEWLKAAAQTAIGVAKEVANAAIDSTPGLAKLERAYQQVRGKPIPRFEANNDAQARGMTVAAVGMVLAPGPGGKTRALSKLAGRARDIAGKLKPGTQSRTTTAVAEVVNANGSTEVLVGSSERTLRPAQREALQAGETAVSGPGHAEVTVINAANARGQTVIRVEASRPICRDCQKAINEVGASTDSPLRP